MPAPPYSAGTEAPSSPSSAICGNMLRSKRCSRSRSLIRGAISRAPHSRTDCSSSRCSSVRSKSNMKPSFCKYENGLLYFDRRPVVLGLAGHRDGGAAAETKLVGGAGGRGGQLEVIGAAEQRADAVARQLGVGGDQPLDALAV